MARYKHRGIGVRVGPLYYGRSHSQRRGETLEDAAEGFITLAGGILGLVKLVIIGAAYVIFAIGVAIWYCLVLCWLGIKYTYLGIAWWWPRRQQTWACIQTTWRQVSDHAVVMWRHLLT